MKRFAIITARGGSKRVPGKNTRDFCGKPVIAYSIEAALESGLFEEVMVSTDSREIAEIGRKYGASVPFMRSKKTSSDFADTADVPHEVVGMYRERGTVFGQFCCIYPTAPFITAQKLRESCQLLQDEEVYSVMPVTAFPFPPQRAVAMHGAFLEAAYPEHFNSRSQDLEELYHDCGQFYWMKTEAFLEKGSLLDEHTRPYFLPESEVQDIDNESDWAMAEIKYRAMREKLKT